VIFGVAWVTASKHFGWDDFRNWRGLILLFVPLAVTTIVLTYGFPGPETAPAQS
jgi:hypothetical protein